MQLTSRLHHRYNDNVSVAANDRCFGIDPTETPDLYDDTDAEQNALEMIPCLREGEVSTAHTMTHHCTHYDSSQNALEMIPCLREGEASSDES